MFFIILIQKHNLRTTISTIAKNVNTNEKTQELLAELAKTAISNSHQSTPIVNLSLPQAKIADAKEEKEEQENILKLHKWEKG